MNCWKASALIVFLALALAQPQPSDAAEAVVVASTQPGLAPGQIVDGAKTVTIDAGKSVSLISETGQAIELKGPYTGAPAPEASNSGDRRVFNALVRTFGGTTHTDSTLGAMRGVSVKLKANEAAGAADAGEVNLYGSSHALVIGIDKYIGGWQPLSNAVEDARTVAEELKRQGFAVTLKTDLSSDALRRTLREFFAIKGEDPNARLLFWFAGHGHTVGGEGFLVPADAPADTSSAFLIDALPMRDFGSLVRLAKSKHVLSIFDSCFSGTIFQARAGAAPRAITRKTTKPVRQFITSGDAGQQVRDDGSFREYFLRALRGDEKADFNSDGYVTGEELGLFLNQRMSALTGAAQTPKSGKLHDVRFNEGDFVFALPRAAARPSVPVISAPSTGSGTAEIVFWQSIQTSGNPAMFEEYLRQYPQGQFAGLARLKVDEMKGGQTIAPAPGTKTPSPTQPAVGVFPKTYNPGDTFKDCPDCPEMVVIPPGNFRMGDLNGGGQDDEKPVHSVRIDYRFAVGKYEVTRGQFADFVRETGYSASGICTVYDGKRWVKEPDWDWRNPRYPQTDDHPVTCVDWHDTKSYVRWLTSKTGKPYRLLSESEWEYAARAGNTTTRFWNSSQQACTHSNSVDLTGKDSHPRWEGVWQCRDGYVYTAPVGSYQPNAFGLYDMLGNLWEWTEDCYNGSYAGAPTDGNAWTSGDCNNHLYRGGSWNTSLDFIRLANRAKFESSHRDGAIGFRIARSLP
jgi:formylglycine-generating enzyme required for sulfatase activity